MLIVISWHLCLVRDSSYAWKRTALPDFPLLSPTSGESAYLAHEEGQQLMLRITTATEHGDLKVTGVGQLEFMVMNFLPSLASCDCLAPSTIYLPSSSDFRHQYNIQTAELLIDCELYKNQIQIRHPVSLMHSHFAFVLKL